MAISNFIPKAGFPQNLRLSFSKVMDLRYGENPHQKAAMYTDGSGSGVANGRQSRARNFPTTTSWICRRPGTWPRNLTEPSAPSSSTPIPAAPPPARLWSRLQEGPGVRSGIGLRGSDRRESRGRWRGCGRDGQALSRSHCRPRFRRGRQSQVRRQEESAPGGDRHAPSEVGA